ncbi:hypothetical protein LEP1GSC016_3906 [Leptospira borgpetersenii serovar Hardjo-bovis str. Sponselee]|uniref:Uncharacterized protein n=1 Tax=Leptospira borgpetersenii serovar Hardjo-bovis str. Sponselee TaxID=1303729 RepID=M6BDA4_LEPBO|nr:hypothetical protein LEP1GSC016_3906 [Leptospira borgpetersenii serovar Hardjo-bovis str. Sponselee]
MREFKIFFLSFKTNSLKKQREVTLQLSRKYKRNHTSVLDKMRVSSNYLT